MTPQDTLEDLEERFFQDVLRDGVGATLANPFEGGELEVSPSLFLKAAMVRKAPVRLTLKDGSFLDGLVKGATAGGGRPSFHTLETGRGLVEVEDDGVSRLEQAPPELSVAPPGPLKRPSSLAEPSETGISL